MRRTLKEDPADYPADGGDNDDNKSSDDDDEDDDETMTTVNQGMSVEEIERAVAQRVDNTIEDIAIYETKTNMARKSISQTKRQEYKVAENASNKRKWEGKHNGSLSQQNKGHKVPKAHTTWPFNKKAYAVSLPLCNQCKFHHNGPCTISILDERHAENKKKLDNTSKNNQNQQQPNKRQNTGRAYTTRHREKKHYDGCKPLCSKFNYHHDGPCSPKYHQCNRFGHLARNYRSSTNANTTNNQKGIGASQKATCYECRNQGHYRRDCPEQKNQNHEKQIKSTKARGVVHALGGGETEQDLNNIEDEIEA
nr:hypothetical protein [Tanacetum cinerariifolium]